MRRPQVNVFNNTPFEALGYLKSFLSSRLLDHELINSLELNDNDWRAIEQPDLSIILGSPASVNDSHPWIASLKEHVRDQLHRGAPVFGICFGAQLIGSVAGASVRRMPASRIGFHDVATNDHESPWRGRWMCFHEEYVEADDRLEILATDGPVPYAFRYGSATAVQFHPEMSPGVISAIVESMDSGSVEVPALQTAMSEYADDYENQFGTLMDYVLHQEFRIFHRS